MSGKKYGISCIYGENDDRLREKTEVVCRYVDRGGEQRTRTVRVTAAERWVIESLAMRLFLDHRKVVKKEKSGDGKIRLTGVVTIGE